MSAENPKNKKVPVFPNSEAEALGHSSLSDADAADKEANLFASGLSEEDLRKQEAQGEHRRNEKFRDHFERVAICFLWVIAGLFLFVGVTWFWHLLMPDNWHWLASSGVGKLQNIVTGGVLTSIAASHFKKRLK